MAGMRAARPQRSPGVPRRRIVSGLTLLEMLVVFVLASFVGTLLIQGSGFFLGQYDTVKRIGREASSETLQQRWFASTVHAIVPYAAAERRFIGDLTSFQGITLQPLVARSGVPVAARWSILTGEEGTDVVYAEQPPPCPADARGANGIAIREPRRHGTDRGSGNVPLASGNIACGPGGTPFSNTQWVVLASEDPLTFQYLGLDRAWRDGWPFEGAREWIPRQVRLVTPGGQIVWSASFGLYHEPVGNPRDFQ